MSTARALAGRIRAALEELGEVVARAETLGERAGLAHDDGYWDGVALNLHGYYTGLERVFEDIGRTVDQSIPSGPEWHQQLLLQMSTAIEETRPAVISRATKQDLEQFRGFRHVVRHLYSYQLRPERVAELLGRLRQSYAEVQRELLAFAAALEDAG